MALQQHPPQYCGAGGMFMTSVRAIALLLAIASFSPAARPQTSQAPNANRPDADSHKMYRLAGFEVSGTRLPTNSVVRISGLKVGQMVNYNIINEACHRITSTGLAS